MNSIDGYKDNYVVGQSMTCVKDTNSSAFYNVLTLY